MILFLILAILKKRRSFVVSCCILAALLLLQTINVVSQERTIRVSDAFFEALSSVDLTDRELLSRMGFEEQGEEYVLHQDSGEASCRIVVSFDPVRKSGLNTHGDIAYEATETRNGIFELRRWFEKEQTVTRWCRFYPGDVCVEVTEHARENSAPEFERVLLSRIGWR